MTFNSLTAISFAAQLEFAREGGSANIGDAA